MAAPWRKYYTQVLDNHFLMSDNNAFLVFMKLIAAANGKGEYGASGREMATFFNLKYPTLYKVLVRLEENKMITIYATPRGKTSIIKIKNWSKYQSTQQISKQQSKQMDKQELLELNDDQVSSKVSSKVASREAAGKQRSEINRYENASKNKNKNSISTNVLIGESPRTRNAEIETMFTQWQEIVGYEISSNIQKNRYACSNLLKKHGADGVIKLINGVAYSHNDRFAPRISDFISLQSRLNDLLVWYKTSNKNNGVEVIS